MKKMIFCLVISIIILPLLAQTAEPPLGVGTSINPYQIANLSNLYWMTQNSSSWDKYFIQTADIDAMSTSSWHNNAGLKPIGNESTEFTGNYNGQNFIIDNLFIVRSSGNNIGLFGKINDASINNLRITNATVHGFENAAILVGYTESSTISNCFTSGIINGISSIGGLIGWASGGIYSNSSSSAIINGSLVAGGFAGTAYENAVITNCNATGNVFGDGGLGGFIGYVNTAVITNCFSRGAVTRKEITYYDLSIIGGFVGENQNGHISKSYCTGFISFINANQPVHNGFSGTNTGNYQANYFDSETSGQAAGYGAEPRSSIQMKTEVNFVNWDFVTIWTIEESVNNGYPVLQNQLVDERLPAPKNLQANVSGANLILTWDAPHEEQPGNSFIEGFESMYFPNGWQNIDADNDGNSWFLYAVAGAAHSGHQCIASASWISNSGALTPNNWLITPAINLTENSTLSWWVGAQDPDWPQDNYDVKISTTSSDISDFTYNLFSETISIAEWTQKTVSLEAYNNQTVYIAFVHNNCTDNFYMKLDDIEVTNVNNQTLFASDFTDPKLLDKYRFEAEVNGQFIAKNKLSTDTGFSNVKSNDTPTGYRIFKNGLVIANLPGNILLFVDQDIESGLYTYAVSAMYGAFLSDKIEVSINAVSDSDITNLQHITALKGNYPNPFNPETLIKFHLQEKSLVSIEIFNVKGQLIKKLTEQEFNSGSHSVLWDGTDSNNKKISAGIYFYKMRSGTYTSTRKMLLLK